MTMGFCSGFARVDLVAVLCTTAVLAVLVFTSAATTSVGSRIAVCLDNQKHLTRAWLEYAEDHGGVLPGNLDGVTGTAQQSQTWCVGWLDNARYTPDNTNTVFLANSQLGKYARGTAIFKCPADVSLNAGKKGVQRVRSVSMNGYMGERGAPYTAGYRQFKTLAQITDPGPSKAFLFIDEREDSICDSWFALSMQGSNPRLPNQTVVVDFPADWHDQAGVLSFADGHAELWRWRDSRTTPPHRPGAALSLGVNTPNNPDVVRLQDAASSRTR